MAAFLRSDSAEELYDRCLYLLNCGMAMAARMPIIAMTIINSISVKPFSFLLTVFFTIRFEMRTGKQRRKHSDMIGRSKKASTPPRRSLFVLILIRIQIYTNNPFKARYAVRSFSKATNASTKVSSTARMLLKTRFGNHFSLISSHMFSTGLHWGE